MSYACLDMNDLHMPLNALFPLYNPSFLFLIGCDEDISPLHTMQGLITRARAQQLDLQLGSMHMLLIRNNGEDQQGLGEGQGVKEEELGHPHQ
jgi:hypothetical protein